MDKKSTQKHIASVKFKRAKNKEIALTNNLFWSSRRDSNPNRSLRRRLRYPVTLRKDFYILKVILRYKIYQFYTTLLHILIAKHNI